MSLHSNLKQYGFVCSVFYVSGCEVQKINLKNFEQTDKNIFSNLAPFNPININRVFYWDSLIFGLEWSLDINNSHMFASLCINEQVCW
jgi:hypothetical protein